jgi:lysophospholipase L1-like esterase/pimeloyl-ACP methyl ester carboxylesterase
MMRWFCSLLVLVLSGSGLAAEEGWQEPQDRAFVSRLDGTEQRYVLLRPADYDPARVYDVLIMLHGHGSDRWQFIRQARAECSESRRFAAQASMICVSPDYRAPTSWMGPAAEADMVQLIDELHRGQRIGRILLLGGSMGGTSALAFAAQHPQLIDGVVSLNGTANMLEYEQFQEAIQASYGGTKDSHREVYRTRSAELFAANLTMPLAATTGGRDTLVPPDSVLRLLQHLQTGGAQVLSLHRPDGGHDTNAQDTREALEFVWKALQQRSAAKAEPAVVRPGQSLRVVCLGDSVTGIYYHTGGRRAWPELLQVGLQRALPGREVAVINAGISGNTVADGLARLQRDVLDHQPQIVTISFGLNDLARSGETQFRDGLLELVRQIRAAGAEPVLCTPNAVIDTAGRPEQKLQQFCQLIRDVATEQQTAFCDVQQAGLKLRERAPQAWRMTMSDAIHPNLDGHRLLAETVCQRLTGVQISLADLRPEPGLPRVQQVLRDGGRLRILAMQPVVEPLQQVLGQLGLSERCDITVWQTMGEQNGRLIARTLPELEAEAQRMVRPLKPDLVLLTYPEQRPELTDEQVIHSVSWIMNWSLDFGRSSWDCAVVHPQLLSREAGSAGSAEWSELLRQLVQAQDLQLLDREPGSTATAEQLLLERLRLLLQP